MRDGFAWGSPDAPRGSTFGGVRRRRKWDTTSARLGTGGLEKDNT